MLADLILCAEIFRNTKNVVNICTLKETCYKIDLLVLALLRWYNRLFAISLIN